MKEINKMEQIAALEILCLPIFLYAYDTLEALFWILLILVDSYELKQIDVKAVMIRMEEESKKPGIMVVLTIGYACGIGVLAFKNLPLAIILVLNELLMSLAAFVNTMNQDKKDKK